MFDISTTALVNAANPQLNNGNGVCGQIFQRAGVEKMEQACGIIRKRLQNGELSSGQIALTKAFGIASAKCDKSI